MDLSEKLRLIFQPERAKPEAWQPQNRHLEPNADHQMATMPSSPTD
jgi:hypothetical protein